MKHFKKCHPQFSLPQPNIIAASDPAAKRTYPFSDNITPKTRSIPQVSDMTEYIANMTKPKKSHPESMNTDKSTHQIANPTPPESIPAEPNSLQCDELNEEEEYQAILDLKFNSLFDLVDEDIKQLRNDPPAECSTQKRDWIVELQH